MKIPCENCICVAVCRHKAYRPMVTECSLIKEILYSDHGDSLLTRSDNFDEVAKCIIEYMNPAWSILPSGNDNPSYIDNHNIRWMGRRKVK